MENTYQTFFYPRIMPSAAVALRCFLSEFTLSLPVYLKLGIFIYLFVSFQTLAADTSIIKEFFEFL